MGVDDVLGADGTLEAGGTLEADEVLGTDGADEVLGTDGAQELNEAEDNREVHGAGDLPGADGSFGSRESRIGETRRTDADAGLAAEDVRRADVDAQGAEEADGAGGRGTQGGTREARQAEDIWGPRGTPGIRGFDDEGVRSALDPDGADEPDVIQAARRRRRTEARSIRARQTPATATGVSDDGEHYVPPPPPPLPKLDSLAKGAWAALFGGPAYLVVATAAGWSVPGIAAFCAVAAFIAGFATLVLRMNDPGPGGPDDGDDGAVV